MENDKGNARYRICVTLRLGAVLMFNELVKMTAVNELKRLAGTTMHAP